MKVSIIGSTKKAISECSVDIKERNKKIIIHILEAMLRQISRSYTPEYWIIWDKLMFERADISLDKLTKIIYANLLQNKKEKEKKDRKPVKGNGKKKVRG
jgi:GH18 family chitinase